MNQTDKAERIALIAIAAMLFLSVAVIFFWSLRSQEIASPVPLGTNQLKIGANSTIHAPTNHTFTVIELNRAYDFPDRKTRSAVRIGSEVIGGSSWRAREKLNKMMVVQ